MGLNSTVRVLIADDHPVYREGVARAFREHEGIELVAEAGDGVSALALAKKHRPDVVVTDLRMPELDGIRLIDRIRDDVSSARVMVLSAYHDPETVYEALHAGAATYLSKRHSRSYICGVAIRVARGEVVMGVEVHEALTADLQPRDYTPRPKLTVREREILGLCADGLRAPAIARELHLGTSTVKTHLASLYRKLDASDRAAAVANGYRRGLVS